MPTQTTARLRLGEEDSDKIKEYAKKQGASVSAVIRKAMEPYLEGRKELPKRQARATETTFLCYAEDFARFKALAKEAGVPWDEAIRLAVQDQLRSSANT